jgi:hypothetical protein
VTDHDRRVAILLIWLVIAVGCAALAELVFVLLRALIGIARDRAEYRAPDLFMNSAARCRVNPARAGVPACQRACQERSQPLARIRNEP